MSTPAADGASGEAGAATDPPGTVVFDLGGVLIDWDPRHLYRDLFDDEDEMEAFLSTVVTPEWNREQDRGRTWEAAVEELAARHPEHRDLIEAYHLRWHDMLAGPIEGTVAVLEELRDRGTRLLALSNWSAETFPVARDRFPFLAWFEGIVISGEERAIKPEPAIFIALVERYGVEPADAVFVDDTAANVEAAGRLGFRTIRFRDPDDLRRRLAALGVLGGGA
jgi:2-haloacid dehalogenase